MKTKFVIVNCLLMIHNFKFRYSKWQLW